MAQGDFTVFAQFKLNLGDGAFNLSTDTHRLALTVGTTTPTETISDPRWNVAGGTDFSAEEVTAGGNYTANGESLGASDHWTLSSATCTFDGADISAWTQNASNPTNATWAILYDDTHATNACIGFLDIGGAFDMTTGDLTVTWNASGIFTLA